MNRKYTYIMLILITAILTLFSPPEKAKADTYTDSYGNWTYSVNGSEATITKYSVVSSTDISIPNIINGYPVTSIGESAFYGSSLTSITIPNSVTSIGDYAFIYCRGLASITIPNSVTSIGDYAFYNCSSLKSITIPNSVTRIDSCVFSGCSSLISITIPNSVTSIGEAAFESCSKLTSITIPNSVTNIGANAFSACSLTSITIPNSVTSIGAHAFQYCSLTSITIPNSVTSIENYAFYNCSSLTSITIANGNVTFGGNGVFNGCSELKTINTYASSSNNNVSNYISSNNLSSVSLNTTSPLTEDTVVASAATLTPNIMTSDSVTLTVKKSDGSVDTGFNGEHNVSISGVKEASDNTYGKFNGIDLTSEAALISPLSNPNYGQTIKLNFENGKATTDLILNTAGNESIEFYVEGVRNPLSNTININSKLIAPTGLIITAGDGNVDLSWNRVSDAKSYKIYEGTQSGVYGTTPVKTVTAPTTSAAITGLANGTTYYFKINASKIGVSDSYNSSEVSAVPVVSITNFANTAKTSSTATFTWTAASGAIGITIEQSEVGSSTWTTSVTTESTINVSAGTAMVTGLTSGSSYKFRLVVTGGANAGISNEVTIAIDAEPITNFANTTKTSSTATFTWIAASGATGITIEQSAVGSSTWTTSVTTDSAINVNAGTATVTGLIPGSGYKFRLVVTGGANAGNSNEVTVTTDAVTPPPIPSATAINDLAAAAGDGQVTLTFTAPEGAVNVVVQQAINGVNYVTATTSSAITAASTSAVVTGLSNGTTYNFRLVVTGGIHAGISNVTTATPVAVTPPPTPPAPEATAASSEANITVVNNIEGVQDIITVTGLNAGDIVRVYNTSTGGSIIGTGTVIVGQTSVTINVAQLGVNAGNVYVSVTSAGKTESLRTGKAYAAEIRNSSLSISTGTFDKNVSKQADIDVYVNFNGNTLTGISSNSSNNGSMALINGTDYVADGNVITIKKNYLSNQNVGSFVLTFNFSSGSAQAMTVTIVNTNINDNTTPIIPSDNDRDDKDDKSSASSNGSTSEVRTVNIFAGVEGSGTPVKVEIKRTTVDGVKLDTIKLETSNIEDAIKKALSGNKKNLIIQIPELKDNPADALEIQLPKASAAKLAENGITLKIDATKAKMEIPEETLKGITGDVKISIKEITDKGKIDETKAMVLEIFADINGEVKLLGKPVEIEANYTGKTEITIPLNTENLPKDPVELKKLLDSLAVHVKHSNGEIVTEKGKIVYDENGNVVGISITVDSFSTFAIVSLSKADMDKLTANNGVISNRATQNGSSKGNSSDSGNKNSDSNLQNSQLPAIKFVGLGHSPLVEGDKEDFIISSGYDGNVQYRIYLNVDGVWQEVTNGYSATVSGQDTFAITPDYTFAKGQYQGRVYVKKAGIAGSKQEDGIDFDNYYTYNINCVDRDDANRVYTAGALEIVSSNNTDKVTDNKAKESTNTAGNSNTSSATESNNSFKTGQKITITGIDGISGIPGPYYYRLSIYDAANDKWTNNVVPYSENLEWTLNAAGTYVLDVHVITHNSVLWDKVKEDPTLIYGGYEGWKLKTVRVNN